MTDSLFDGRYRYDYIYPRGRSGETLRAVDTHDNDRPVVIKRPAPNDAPPIRAGQEVSILNERKALQRLAGHPVLTELLGNGQFVIGGIQHQYIVIERGQGVLVADMVLEFATRGERMPELEMLVIIDQMLDLLFIAHSNDIVYNDVDAKHLFWDRDNYTLKLIDWGNAVFLEGDDMTPQGISRQSDIYQVAELLYFILTGGGRMEVPRSAGTDFRLDFGAAAERTPHDLQSIISRAAHPDLRLRYTSLDDMRGDLSAFRAPIEAQRNAALNQVEARLEAAGLSRDELQGLLETLEPALATNPGFPAARSLSREILSQLRDLEVSADLDAVRIYMESANWTRALNLLRELRPKAGKQTGPLLDLLIDCAALLDDPPFDVHEGTRIPASALLLDALTLIFEGHAARAAQLLLAQETEDSAQRSVQWLMAERISAHVPNVIVLRPNLYRLDIALRQLAADGLVVTEPRALLAEAQNTFDNLVSGNLIELRDTYRTVVDTLTALSTLLETIEKIPEARLPLAALDRALNAAMALADNMHVIGKQAAANPEEATGALESSRRIDPLNPVWDIVSRLLNGLYELLQSYQTYVPASDGSDLSIWLQTSQRDLAPFIERLFDEMLVSMVEGLHVAADSWQIYASATVQGNRMRTVTVLAQASEAVSTISPTLAGWFNQLRRVVAGARYVERHALYGGLGRALADGWDAYDRGRLVDAERLGQQASEIARSEPELFAARRLRTLAEVTRAWVDRNSVANPQMTQEALATIEQLYMPDENEAREAFTAQMPSNDTYLRAMGKGLIELYARSSTAAVRILFFHYCLLGTLDAHEGNLEDADFWHEAMLKTLDEYANRHVAFVALGEYIQQRRDILAAERLLSHVNGSHALVTLEDTRRQLEENPQARVLSAGIHSLRELEAAVRDWTDGEFRAAGMKLENAIRASNEIEEAAHITLEGYRTWLMELQANTAELHTHTRELNKIIDQRPTEPPAALLDIHRHQAQITVQLLGEAYAATLGQWRDAYEGFLAVYSDGEMRRSKKLERFNERFRAMFIDRHPAYPLYRFWYDTVEQAPEFPAPPTDEPVPQLREDEHLADEPEVHLPDPEERRPRLRIPRRIVFGSLGGLILLIVIAFASGALTSGGEGPEIAVTITDTPTPDGTQTAIGVAALSASPTVEASVTPSTTLDPAEITPTLLPSTSEFVTATLATSPIAAVSDSTQAPATQTPVPSLTATPAPTLTPLPTLTPSDTPTPTPSDTPTPTATATLPPEGVQGRQDLLAFIEQLPQAPWDAEIFSFANSPDGATWRLGVGSETPGDILFIKLPPERFEERFGNNAATRIRRAEATLVLTTFNPTLLSTDEVFFGMLFENLDAPEDTAGLQVQATQPGVINLNQRIGETLAFISQRSVNGVIVRVRLEHDSANGNIVIFLNGQELGPPIPFGDPETPMLPVLFVKDGGVIINITEWSVTLQ